jgi:hypothetical protein
MTIKMRRLSGIVIAGSVLSIPVFGYATKQYLNESEWTIQGTRALALADKLSSQQHDRARNVILFAGEEHKLAFEEFPYLSLVKTYSVNQQTSDSAPTMTAMVTGVKTEDGILSVDEDVVHSDHTTATRTVRVTAAVHGQISARWTRPRSVSSRRRRSPWAPRRTRARTWPSMLVAPAHTSCMEARSRPSPST